MGKGDKRTKKEKYALEVLGYQDLQKRQNQ